MQHLLDLTYIILFDLDYAEQFPQYALYAIRSMLKILKNNAPIIIKQIGMIK